MKAGRCRGAQHWHEYDCEFSHSFRPFPDLSDVHAQLGKNSDSVSTKQLPVCARLVCANFLESERALEFRNRRGRRVPSGMSIPA